MVELVKFEKMNREQLKKISKYLFRLLGAVCMSVSEKENYDNISDNKLQVNIYFF